MDNTHLSSKWEGRICRYVLINVRNKNCLTFCGVTIGIGEPLYISNYLSQVANSLRDFAWENIFSLNCVPLLLLPTFFWLGPGWNWRIKLIEITFFVCSNRIYLVYQASFLQATIVAKGFLNLANWFMIIKRKGQSLTRNFALVTLGILPSS